MFATTRAMRSTESLLNPILKRSLSYSAYEPYYAPTMWWALYFHAFMPIGICEGYEDAQRKARDEYGQFAWVANRSDLRTFRKSIRKELSNVPRNPDTAKLSWWAIREGVPLFIGDFSSFDEAADAAYDKFLGGTMIVGRESMESLIMRATEELEAK